MWRMILNDHDGQCATSSLALARHSARPVHVCASLNNDDEEYHAGIDTARTEKRRQFERRAHSTRGLT
jgi:hypothetical protein